MKNRHTFPQTIVVIAALAVLAACGRGDSVSVQPATLSPTLDAYPALADAYPEPPIVASTVTTTPSPEPFDPENPNTWPTPIIPPATQTAAAILDQNIQDYNNMLATSAAESESLFATQQASGEWPTPVPPQRTTPIPTSTPSVGLFNSYPNCLEDYRVAIGTFSVVSCWHGTYKGIRTTINAGGFVNHDPNDFLKETVDGGLYVYTYLDPTSDGDESPFYETPNKERAEMTSVEGDVVTVRTDSALYTFDLASRTWSAPLTATPTPTAQ